jgi:phosphoribosylanthranilate isomerase
MTNNLIQIAGAKNLKETQMLLKARADHIGFPLRLPHGGEDLTEDMARKIIQKIDQPDKFVLITYLTEPAAVIKFCEYLNIHKVQLHNDLHPTMLQEINQKAPALQIIKSLIIKENNQEHLADYIAKSYQYVDYYITDTYDPETQAIGATGKTHNWEISKKIVEISPRPVILAGGLDPHNISEAIKYVQPDGVDAHTGLEDNQGHKDPDLVQKFVKRAQKAFSEINHQVQKLAIDGILDLHTFKPEDVKSLVLEYINECLQNDIYEIKIIHGKGKGVLRRTVRSILAKHPEVIYYGTDREYGGNWGATIATLRPKTNQE